MVRGRREEQWGHTSSLMALIVNCHPFRKKGARLASPEDFNPLLKKARSDIIKGPISALKVMLAK